MDKGVMYFRMELEFYINGNVLPLMNRYYGDVEVTWGDNEVWLVTGDGEYRGVTVRVNGESCEVYKTGREFLSESIYDWFGGSLKVLHGERYCDSPYEYRLLMEGVVNPLQGIVTRIKEEGKFRQFIGAYEVEVATGIKLTEYRRLVRAVSRFAEGLQDVLGVPVEYEDYGYYSREMYKGLGTAWVTIPGYRITIIYNLPKNWVGVYKDVEGEGMVGVEGELRMVARNVLKTKGFTKYDKIRLMDSVENLVGEV